MAEAMEPPVKKSKKADNLDEFIQNVVNLTTNLYPIMDDVYYNNSISLIKCYAGHVKDLKMLSTIIHILNDKLPLKDLHHLKRVNKHSVLLCPKNQFSIVKYESIQEFIEHHVPQLCDVFEYIREVEVPAVAPLTRKQNLECSKKWTCNFHPNIHIERMLSDSCFKQNELHLHRTYMGMALHLAGIGLAKGDSVPTAQDLLSSDVNAAIVVDPVNKSVVAIAFDNRKNHPIQHATMLAIDNVAKTQNGGAWNSNEEQLKDYTWKLRNKYFDIAFGARKFISKQEVTENDKVENSPYLCTGYDIYLVREPCIMCAMGLVHARIKRVFYTFENHVLGALRSKTKLHLVQSLNHRFDVFTGFSL